MPPLTQQELETQRRADRTATKATVIAAASLLSSDEENAEYDRALVELVGTMLGIDMSDEAARYAILTMMRALV